MEKIILRIFIAEQSLKKWRRGLTDSTPLFHFIVYLSYGSLFFQKNSSPSSLGSFANTLIFVLTNTNNFFSYCACPIWDVSHFTPLSPTEGKKFIVYVWVAVTTPVFWKYRTSYLLDIIISGRKYKWSQEQEVRGHHKNKRS